ncbi:DUF1684 domain-containing protein [Nocardia sp. R6R-6]|uniref:DUF1684 domain-containing protein n=1 Tax=Nocardia sp. R6R-6 TaxID=3459303 RepID=UPI00403DB7B2
MTASITATSGNWLADWQQWRAERNALATAPDGLAAVTGTHWLLAEPTRIEGLPGTWAAAAGGAVADGPDGLHLELAAGTRHSVGGLVVQSLVRAGRVALRVFDPQAPTRLGLEAVDAFDPDPAWVFDGVIEGAAQALQLNHIDGFVSDNAAARIRLTIDGHHVTLWGTTTSVGDVQITFADTTNGRETARFRFLTVAAPDDSGRVTVDFNRAYLPPCAFAAHYLCPLPPPENRLGFPIRAGETRLRRSERTRR